MRFLRKQIFRNALTLCVSVLFLLCLFPRTAAAASFSRNVTSHAEIVAAIGEAGVGDTVTLVLQNSMKIGGTPAIKIPSGVNVIWTNKPGVQVKVTRDTSNRGISSRIDILGSLTVQEDTTGGGSLTFNGESTYCWGNSQFAVYNAGSQLHIKSGTYTNAVSNHGLVYCADEAQMTVDGGMFQNNMSFNEGGVIWAANSSVTINGGTFDQNSSGITGGAIYYEGRATTNKLLINGGTFSNNEANGGFGGGAIYIDCIDGTTVAEINAATFSGNKAINGFGGAIYIQNGAEVKIANAAIYQNSATKDGGGIWNCPTGGGNYYTFHGMYLAGNSAGDLGDDFYSVPKEIDVSIYLTDYAFNGEKCNWTYDDGLHPIGTPAPSDYYQNTMTLVALKSGLTGTPTADVVFTGNNAVESGGAIANNGMLDVGKATAVAVRKQTNVGTNEDFSFSVSLTRNGAALAGSFLYTDSASATPKRIVFDNSGMGTLSLKSGQTITILDLPIGTHFTITETALPDGWRLVGNNNLQGTISANATGVPTFENLFMNTNAAAPETEVLDVPKTGDASRPGLWAAILLLSALGLGTLRLIKKRITADD